MAKRILIAEDEPNIIESLVFLLNRAGCEVTVETDGGKALATALEMAPDLLVLDVMLPGMTGYEVLRELRADERTKALPVIVLTAKGQREDRNTALDSGADLFITKPFSNKDIVASVLQLLGEGRA